MNDIPKVVFSRTLERADWGPVLPIFADRAQLRLRGARTFPAGTVALHYERA